MIQPNFSSPNPTHTFTASREATGNLRCSDHPDLRKVKAESGIGKWNSPWYKERIGYSNGNLHSHSPVTWPCMNLLWWFLDTILYLARSSQGKEEWCSIPYSYDILLSEGLDALRNPCPNVMFYLWIWAKHPRWADPLDFSNTALCSALS